MTDVLVEQTDRIATVVFNRPRRRNAISFSMWSEIARVTAGLAKDDSIRAIVYRGAGTEAFASGADISEFKEHRNYLNQVADNAPLSVRGAKVTVQYYLEGLDADRRARLKQLALEASESEDYKEGTGAFLEKRSPKFQGR